jgi:hypothetical protein
MSDGWAPASFVLSATIGRAIILQKKFCQSRHSIESFWMRHAQTPESCADGLT